MAESQPCGARKSGRALAARTLRGGREVGGTRGGIEGEEDGEYVVRVAGEAVVQREFQLIGKEGGRGDGGDAEVGGGVARESRRGRRKDVVDAVRRVLLEVIVIGETSTLGAGREPGGARWGAAGRCRRRGRGPGRPGGRRGGRRRTRPG